MPLDTRAFLGLEDSEEWPFDHALKIPPLQHPLPLLASRRPSPLEPVARVENGAHNPAARLNTRAKALVDAKQTRSDETSRASDSSVKPAGDQSQDLRPYGDGARKRQKLDFFQLPKPSTRSNASKHPAFGSVPVLLNELHEPPPSAALFPPITANLVDEAASNDTRPAPSRPSVEDSKQEESPLKNAKCTPRGGADGKQKRVYLRGRRPWTTKETDDLLKGVAAHGVGKWKTILRHEGLHFHPDRTAVDLKDRYRTCRLNEEKADGRRASQMEDEVYEIVTCNASGPEDASSKEVPTDPQGSGPCVEDHKVPSNKGKADLSQPFNISTPLDFEGQLSGSGQQKRSALNVVDTKKQHLPRWTIAEDASLSKGYEKYGFQWTAITKDPEMGLGHRTGPQLRDRFRLKYALHYRASIPLPLPEDAKRARQRESSVGLKPSKSAPKTSGNHRQELTWILRDSSEPPRQVKPHSSLEKVVGGQDKIGPHKNRRNSFPFKYLQDEHDLAQEHGEKAVDVEAVYGSQSTPSSSLTPGNHSRQSSMDADADADETRNLNIDELLNSESEQHSRLPPFKFPFDNDWGSETINENQSVTLPPLLWDDMASRPLFDLE